MIVENKSIDELIHNENEDLSIVNANEDLELNSEDNRKIVWQAKDFSIREFASMLQDGDLDLQPEYQRNYVATPKIASKLIESVIMDVPIPVIYLAEEIDGSFSVIDGQQRLTSFLSFMNGKFPNGDLFKLTGLKVFKELNRKLFSNLEKEFQNKIRKTTLHTIIIKKESNEDVKFEIFERLNTGSIKLNEDEIRNTVYRGNYIKLLSELENNETFHKLVQKDNYKKRMIYRGMILRFFALSEKSYINYQPSMKQFCNKELRDNRHLATEKQKEYETRFLNCIDLVKTVFGKKSFRRYMVSDEDKSTGSWATTRINMALYDIQMCGFVNYSKNDILRNADYIREAMIQLMTDNQEFIDSILLKTSSKEVLKKRFKIWLEKLEEIVGDNNYNQRNFSYQIKEELFYNDPKCSISGQKILAIEDSEVDHILPYSKGGETSLKNAQLVLRYFNRAKKNNTEYK
jgi:5-methylcytosine-specific restriction endonuclease McrA